MQAEVVDYQPAVPYVGLLAALDKISVGEVYVLGTGGGEVAAGWGELLSTACQAVGAVGSLVDSPIRDADLVAGMDFPVFGRGRHPSDCHGRLEVLSHGGPVQIGGVTIHPGDVVVGDADGVVVIPAGVADQVLASAFEKGELESEFRAAVAGGMKPSEAFSRFGVL